jgi:hypothetical protein
MSVDRLTLVELIEGEAAKLSPRGRELWERLELHVETTSPEEATPETIGPPDPEQIEGMEVEWGGPGLVHDEDLEAFFTPNGELALSREYVNLEHLMGPARMDAWRGEGA